MTAVAAVGALLYKPSATRRTRARNYLRRLT
jgi:hypothetical protein